MAEAAGRAGDDLVAQAVDYCDGLILALLAAPAAAKRDLERSHFLVLHGCGFREKASLEEAASLF
jgi:hypothetical protein